MIFGVVITTRYPLIVTYSADISEYCNCSNKYIYSSRLEIVRKVFFLEDTSIISQITNVDTAYDKLIFSFINARNRSVLRKTEKFKHKYSPYWTAQCSLAKQNKLEI